MTKGYDAHRHFRAPPIRSHNLISKLRRIRWELSATMERTRDEPTMGEMAALVEQTDATIARMEARGRKS